MQIHQLQPIHKERDHKRVGRGGKRGTTSGHGQKGQTSRGGRKFQPIIREFIKRYPKLRGYRFGTGRKEIFVILDLAVLEKNFSAKDIVNPEKLVEKGILGRIDNRIPVVKILGKSEMTKSLVIENCLVSKGAKEKIEKAGGQVVDSDLQKARTKKAEKKEAKFIQRSAKKAEAMQKAAAKEKAAAAKAAQPKVKKEAKAPAARPVKGKGKK
jgi:large subunit ribosomal protein L15